MSDLARRMRRLKLCALCGAALLLACAPFARTRAQLSERPGDPLGGSVRVARVQVIHSDAAGTPGTSMDLQQTDPWLAYQMGYFYFQREWKRSDGLFSTLSQRPLAAAANSCAVCHNLPFRSAGAGGNVPEPGGFGRNTPHLFGIGLVESIGLQVRRQIMADFDRNGNGFLDYPEETKGRRAVVEAAPGVRVDFGALDDDDGDGEPDLNEVVKVALVDQNGSPRPFRPDGSRSQLGDPGVAGYDLSVAVLSSSRAGDQEPSLRMFAQGVLHTVMGLGLEDHTVSNNTGRGRDERAGDYWAEVSNAGTPQPYAPPAPPAERDPFKHVSEGELDLLEWFLLNSPAPATGRQDAQTAHGRREFSRMGCVKCHVADWVIRPADARRGLPGDRRFFDLEVGYDARTASLRGRLHDLTGRARGPNGSTLLLPRRGGFTVRGVYTDLLHHDVGERFHDYTYEGGRLYVERKFRTPPLWGCGSTAPYGHDGRSPTLDAVIRRHGGEAREAARAYVEAEPAARAALNAFLRSLVLYQPDALPTDLDGDGLIAPAFRAGGLEVGPELFRPELLFRTPPRYRGRVADAGGTYFSYELLNLEDLYGRTLEALLDKDGDGIPDVAGGTERANSRPSHTR
jgi:hypothetical protein